MPEKTLGADALAVDPLMKTSGSSFGAYLQSSGYANKAISAHLDINEETTKTHIKNILAKLGARDRTHAVSLGLKRGIILL